ncbi:M48 family metallopeptidase [Caulobacter sp. 17J65-9]|nr:M48 family metallopeptidase [Caulobacter sp. 17J65-9]
MMASFDAAAATAQYLAQLSPEAHAKAVAYTQGGHWLLLGGFLVSVVVAFVVLRSGVLTRIRDGLEKRRPRPVLVSFVGALVFLGLDWLLSLPWSAYASWWREKSYGLNNQTWDAWLSEAAIGAAISTLMTAIFLVVLYALIRKAPRTWWAWGGALSAAFILFSVLIAPIYIEPLFNTYKEAQPGPVRDAVVQLAHENGVPTDKVFVFDGSRQSNRYTANVSGLGSTARIAMSDAMLTRATLPEVRGVVGHEIGHYKQMHVIWFTAAFAVLSALGFWLVHALFPVVGRLLGAGDVKSIADPAGLPVIWVVLALLGLLGTPVFNTIFRTAEADADRYSLEHANEPDGLAAALVKTVEYRASSPGKLEEVLFYDHPSVENRVRRAMEWKAAHPKPEPVPEAAPAAAPAAPPAEPASAKS